MPRTGPEPPAAGPEHPLRGICPPGPSANPLTRAWARPHGADAVPYPGARDRGNGENVSLHAASTGKIIVIWGW